MKDRPFYLKSRWFLLAVLFLTAAAWTHRFFYEPPVLMYHHVGVSEGHSGEFVSPEAFERQMEFLKVHRYRVIGFSQLVREIKEGAALPAKTVCITFDDGNLDNFRYAFPILKKMGFPATLFMITANIDRQGWLSGEDLKILDDSGITIGSHTVNHAFLPNDTPEEIKKELEESKGTLEGLLKHPVGLFSYPAGGVTPAIERQVGEAGYEGAATTNYGKDRRDPYAVHRIKIGESSGNLFHFWVKTSGYAYLGKKRVTAKGSPDED